MLVWCAFVPVNQGIVPPIHIWFNRLIVSQCVDGYPYLNRCPSGLYFDDISKYCTFKAEARCGPISTSEYDSKSINWTSPTHVPLTGVSKIGLCVGARMEREPSTLREYLKALNIHSPNTICSHNATLCLTFSCWCIKH